MNIIKIINKINIILFLILLIIFSNTTAVYSKGVYISGARVYSSSKTYTKSITSKSITISTVNTKGFNSSGSTSIILTPIWLPFLFLMHGNNYNINGYDKNLDYTLSNIIIKLLINNYQVRTP